MDKHSKGRSWPMPDAGIKNIIFKLEEALSNESQFICNYAERKPWEVTMSARDGAAHVLRFLKVWFDAPEGVFFSAVYYLDNFLARMKVQEKFLPCLTVSCFNLAAQNHGFKINTSHLVLLSQSKCSVKDMERMSAIITEKLNLGSLTNCNHLDQLQVFMDIFKYIAVQFKIQGLLNRMLQWQQLCTRLEILLCDSSCAAFKPSVLALAFIHFEMDRFLSKENPKKSNYYSTEMFYILAVMIELQTLCNINSSDYKTCFENITNVLKEYDRRTKTTHCQKLTWRFSISTLALSKFSQNYYSMLNTITEE
ncbi:cyclin G [Tribolium castaneum]|uniref:Cyclin-I-like Protein n=1 Tax=Tribolium castaneum TaxID=7070 RepID=D7EK68_TRICA|nr:PREDICTED: cyclin-G2 [Tribolium castaneum]EFA13016.1 Cyclin-I-like Protein [Tribolium castaneum]|eukprot:XP_968026.1 PREDICTED: cyclin-G2 [Tribolium castaneum]